MHLIILVGTVTQTALEVAQSLTLVNAAPISRVSIVLMDGLDLSVFDEQNAAQTVYLICCSTTGSGSVPENAHVFLSAFIEKPQYLGHVRYGLIALGDSSYANTFCHGALQFDDKLQDLGAQRIGSIFQHDACTGSLPQDEALPWFANWLTKIYPT
jgi:MioC protein